MRACERSKSVKPRSRRSQPCNAIAIVWAQVTAPERIVEHEAVCPSPTLRLVSSSQQECVPLSSRSIRGRKLESVPRLVAVSPDSDFCLALRSRILDRVPNAKCLIPSPSRHRDPLGPVLGAEFGPADYVRSRYPTPAHLLRLTLPDRMHA
jgi:hypothetical protein